MQILLLLLLLNVRGKEMCLRHAELLELLLMLVLLLLLLTESELLCLQLRGGCLLSVEPNACATRTTHALVDAQAAGIVQV